MPPVFKKSITRYLDADGRQVPKGTPGARKAREKSAKWYGRVPGAARPVPLCENKTAAQMMLNELVKKAELAKVGIADPFEEHKRRPPLPAGDCRVRAGAARQGQLRPDDQLLSEPPEELLPLAGQGPPDGRKPRRPPGGGQRGGRSEARPAGTGGR